MKTYKFENTAVTSIFDIFFLISFLIFPLNVKFSYKVPGLAFARVISWVEIEKITFLSKNLRREPNFDLLPDGIFERFQRI